jgi:hypothetical protein
MEEYSYMDYRDHIKTGSCLLVKGTRPVSRIIRIFTKYSHAGLVLRLDRYTNLRQRVFVSESLMKGTILTLLSIRVNEEAECFLFEPENLTPEISENIAQSSIVNAAARIKYDFPGLFANFFGRVNMTLERFFCSSYVWHEWVVNGILTPERLTQEGFEALEKNKAPRPGDLPNWIKGKLIKIVP